MPDTTETVDQYKARLSTENASNYSIQPGDRQAIKVDPTPDAYKITHEPSTKVSTGN